VDALIGDAMICKRWVFLVLSLTVFFFALSCSSGEEIAKQNKAAAKAVLLEAISDDFAVQEMEGGIDEQIRLQNEFERPLDEEPIAAMPNR